MEVHVFRWLIAHSSASEDHRDHHVTTMILMVDCMVYYDRQTETSPDDEVCNCLLNHLNIVMIYCLNFIQKKNKLKCVF